MARCPRCHRRVPEGGRCPADGASAPIPLRPAPAAPAIPGLAIARPLGAGGFAAVWEARDRSGRTVAVKVAHGANLAARQRFAREEDALRGVGPTRAPALFEAGATDDGRPYLVLERLEGRTLAEFLASRPGPEPGEAIRVGRRLARLLAGVHAAGVVHRDLKPENVFVDGDRLRLIDFGLAPARDDGAGGGFRTRAGVVVGTPAYMAPEQLRGEAADARVDVYALGVLLYELATLHLPFSGGPAAIEYGHLMRRPPSPRHHAAVPDALEQLLARCLVKDPHRRPRSDEVARALEEMSPEATGPAGRALGPAGALVRQPVVLAAVTGAVDVVEVADAVATRGGVLVGERGPGLLGAFTGAGGDPLAAAESAAAGLADAGAAVVLHVATAQVWSRGDRPPMLFGPEVDDPSWAVAPTGHGVHRTEAFAGARPRESLAPERIIGRDASVARARASAGRAFAEGRPRLLIAIGAEGSGRSRLATELRAVASASGATVLEPSFDHVDPIASGVAFCARAARGPAALVVDDADRLPSAALDAVEFATLERSDTPLWVVLVGGPRLEVRRPHLGRRAAACDRLELAPLSSGEARKLAAAFLRAEYVPAEALDRLVRWADRSPRMLEAATAALRRRGALHRGDDGRWRLDVAALDELPEAPDAGWLASAALAQLPPDVAELAELAALMAPGFDVERIERVQHGLERAGEPAPVLDAAVGLFQLCRRGLLERGPDGDHRFASDALRAAVAGRYPPGRRAAVHRIALAELGPADLEARAHHAVGAGAVREAGRLRTTLGHDALRTHRAADAERHFSSALELVDEATARAVALSGRGRARYRIDRAADAVADLREAVAIAERCGDERLRVTALLELATALDWCGDYEASERAARDAASAAPDEPFFEVRVDCALGRSAWRSDRIDEAVRFLESVVAGAAALDDHETRVVSLLLLAPALCRSGRLDEAERRFDEVIDLCEHARDRLHLCAAHGNRMFLWSARKRPDRAATDLRRACELAQEVGHPGPERVATYNLAEDLYWAGDPDALPLARRARRLQEQFVGAAAEDPLLLARVYTDRGDVDAARAELDYIERSVPDRDRSTAVRLLVRMLRLVHDRERGAAWNRLVAEASERLPGDDLLEILYWRARTAGPGPERRAVLERAEVLLPEFPIWRARFSELPR